MAVFCQAVSWEYSQGLKADVSTCFEVSGELIVRDRSDHSNPPWVIYPTEDWCFQEHYRMTLHGKTQEKRDQKTLNKLGTCKPLKKSAFVCGGSSRLVPQPTWGCSHIFKHLKESSSQVFWHFSWKLGTSKNEKRRDQHRCQWLDPWLALGSQSESTIVKEETYHFSSQNRKDKLTNKPVCFLPLIFVLSFPLGY